MHSEADDPPRRLIVLDTAYDWLCRRRRAYPVDADVWSFRQRWPAEKDRLKAELAAGRYRFGLLTRIRLVDGEEVDLWSARDALVLKALAIVLARRLPISPRCTHVKGHGGGKAAVRQVRDHPAENRFVLRTDVKSYYASIDHFLLMDQLAGYIGDRPSWLIACHLRGEHIPLPTHRFDELRIFGIGLDFPA